jgi:DNA-directed RNA polymerase specialized sigma24 family protein
MPQSDFTMRERREWANRVDFESLSEVDVADSTVERYEQRRQIASLAVFLNELPPNCRKAFLMHKIEGYSHSEVAEKSVYPRAWWKSMWFAR